MKNECGNCAYYLDRNRVRPSGYGTCRRFPEPVDTNDGRWCGEHKPAPPPGDMSSQGMPITFTYTNWRGETAQRTAVPKRIWFGSTDWHPEHGWLMTAHDLEKAADRDFALADCAFAAPRESAQEAARVLLDALNEASELDDQIQNAMGEEASNEGIDEWVFVFRAALRALSQERHL